MKVNKEPQPYDEFMNYDDDNSADSHGSLIYFINDHEADSINRYRHGSSQTNTYC